MIGQVQAHESAYFEGPQYLFGIRHFPYLKLGIQDFPYLKLGIRDFLI